MSLPARPVLEDFETASWGELHAHGELVAAWELELAAIARRLGAELAVREAFNRHRLGLGHDYGNGQRWNELSRRGRELHELAERLERSNVPVVLEPAHEDLVRAYNTFTRRTATNMRRAPTQAGRLALAVGRTRLELGLEPGETIAVAVPVWTRRGRTDDQHYSLALAAPAALTLTPEN